MMHCYRCNSTENLSVKSQRKSSGYKLMICKPCRNEWARLHKSRPKEKITPMDDWNLRALETLQRIGEKYAAK